MASKRTRAPGSQAITGVAPADAAARSHCAVMSRKSAAALIGRRFAAASTSGARPKITMARDISPSYYRLEFAAHASQRHQRDRAAEERAGASARTRDRRDHRADDDAAP